MTFFNRIRIRNLIKNRKFNYKQDNNNFIVQHKMHNPGDSIFCGPSQLWVSGLTDDSGAKGVNHMHLLYHHVCDWQRVMNYQDDFALNSLLWNNFSIKYLRKDRIVIVLGDVNFPEKHHSNITILLQMNVHIFLHLISLKDWPRIVSWSMHSQL